MHLTDSLDACLLIACFIAIPMLLTCKSEARRVPTNMVFAFGNEYSISKRGDFITVSRASRWTDSQIPPPPEFDRTSAAVLVTQQEFDSLWDEINAGDFKSLADPAKLTFQKTPPGMAYVEVLTYIVEKDTIVNWSRASEKLAAPVRSPLDELTRQIASLYEKRNTELVLPHDFGLRLKTEENGEVSVGMNAGAASVNKTGTAQSVPTSRFEQFWRMVVDLRLLKHEFSTFAAVNTETATFELSLRVNEIELPGGKFVFLKDDEAIVSGLLQAIEVLAKE